MFILQLWTDVEIRRSLFTSFRAQLFLFSLSLPFCARILGFVSTVDTEKREGGFIFIYVSLSLSLAPIQPTSSFLLFSI